MHLMLISFAGAPTQGRDRSGLVVNYQSADRWRLGELADLAVLSKDYFKVPLEEFCSQICTGRCSKAQHPGRREKPE